MKVVINEIPDKPLAEMTDLERCYVAFEELRKRKFWARISQAGGWSAVPLDIIRRSGRCVFWDDVDTAKVFRPNQRLRQPLHLSHFERHTDEIVEVLSKVFPGRVLVDRSPSGGVVIQPQDFEPIDAERSHQHQDIVGKRFLMLTPVANEWIVTAASVHQVRLVASDAEGVWLTLPLRRFTAHIVEQRIVEMAA